MLGPLKHPEALTAASSPDSSESSCESELECCRHPNAYLALLLPQVVESLRRGHTPHHAAQDAVKRILRFYPKYVGAVIAVDVSGRHAAAAAGWNFTYAFRDASMQQADTISIGSISSLAAS